ncbi:protein DOWNY MILDEW RESISTANCE 6-like [Asparagus officinalis]|uniref:protein DOWNY MILDEW RESISTANCE 6-like n=1 Tax=Asparagus officinalis TaxID=4686 RepID=UPI00098E06A9|nr:protein DOWNY MILDEW RESISTANCE 6-like [Asparagus officinalis]
MKASKGDCGADITSLTSALGLKHHNLPESYIRPEPERPRLNEVQTDRNIPVIDLNCPDKSRIIAQVTGACRTYGIFQVVNHGVSVELTTKMAMIGLEFFRLPAEEKMSLYSDDPAKKMRLSTSFNVQKEKVHNWRDYLRLHCYPLEEYVPGWPSNPPSFREVASTYCKEIRLLGFRLLGLISLSLGLEEGYIERVLGEQEQHMAINYYPPCPEPELTFGLPAHTDPNALTVLLQDQDVPGLQILKDGRWFAVEPCPDAFVVNIGDQLQALSNGKYKSVWHRAVVNSNKERMSIASFLCPCNSVVISPPSKLISENDPAIYRSYTYDEYYKKFWGRNLDQEHWPWKLIQKPLILTVQEYTPEFQQQAMILNIATKEYSIFMKYMVGLSDYIRKEMNLFTIETIADASMKAITIEGKQKKSNEMTGDAKQAGGESGGSKPKEEKKGDPEKAELICSHCEKTGRITDRCWENHLTGDDGFFDGVEAEGGEVIGGTEMTMMGRRKIGF